MSRERLVYLVRHGLAGEHSPEYPDDSRRPLTAAGMARMREIGAGLVALGVEVDRILTSPYVRTRQTADLLAAAWDHPPAVSNLDALAVDGRVAAVLPALATSPEDGTPLALVGHMPGIGVLAAELLDQAHPLDFKKGAVACLAVDGVPRRGCATLRWFATPRMLRLLGKRR
jgi:phosphohistidine phosphatase